MKLFAFLVTLAVTAPVQAQQKVEEINYLLPAPSFLPAFIPWVLAQQRGYYAQEGLKVTFQIGKDGVDVQAAGPTGIWQQFAAGKAQAFAGPVDWALNARDAGAKIKIYRGDAFFPSMAQAILASDEMIQKRPDLVRKLVKATLRG